MDGLINTGVIMALMGAAALAVAAILLRWLVLPAARGERGLDNPVGIAIPSTMRSEEAWLAGHRAAAGPTAWVAGTAQVFCALMALSVFLPQGVTPHPVTMMLLFVGHVCVVLGFGWMVLAAHRGALSAPGRPDSA